MNRHTRLLIAGLLCFALLAQGSGLALAQQQDEQEDEDDDQPIVNIDLAGVIDAVSDAVDEIQELSGSLDDILVDAGTQLLVKPGQLLANLLSDLLTMIMVAYPSVKSEGIRQLHWLIYQITLLLAVPVFIWIGFQHIIGRMDAVRPTAKLVLTLALGGLAPWLLYYPIEVSRLVTLALEPGQVSVIGSLSVSLAMAAIIWLKAIVLLILILLFAAKNYYLMYYVVAAPLIFLLTFFEPTRDHMKQLTGLFIGCLLISPLDMIAYRLVLIQLKLTSLSGIPDFIWGIAGLSVMLAIPYVVLSSGTSLVVPGIMVAEETSSRIGEQVKPVVREKVGNRYQDWREDKPSFRDVGRRAGNRFLDDRVDVKLEDNSRGEVEMRPRSSIGNRARELKDRLTSDEREEVDVEGGEWWGQRAELKESDD